MLKQYKSIREIARDMRDIKRKSRPLASDLIATLAASNEIFVRGKGTVKVSNEPKLTREAGRELTKKTNDLNTLVTHQKEINNILNTLQNEFADGDYPEKEKLIQAAKRLAANLDDKVDTLKASLSIDAKETLPDLLGQISNLLKKNLDKEMESICKTKRVQALTVLIKDNPQHTMYFIYTDVEDEKGEVTPKVVFALSHYEGENYINPSLHDTTIPGKFSLGIKLKGSTASELAANALKAINTQLVADSMLSAVVGLPVPFSKTKLSKLQKDTNVTMVFAPNDDAIIVKVRDKLFNPVNRKNPIEVKDNYIQDIANKITLQINSLILRDKDLPKMSIKYTKRRLPSGWELVYKFLPAGKYNGKTLSQLDVEHLRERFTEEEIQHFLIALQK